MNSDFYAVLLGFNNFRSQRLPDLEYAEKDAEDLFQVLTDEDYGNYAKENIHLITGEATENDIETILYSTIVNNRTPKDTVLVFYSGHGFFANGKTFLGTPNVSLSTILNNPKAGLRMDYLYNDIFLETRAKNVFFILDCCYSGSFFPNLSNCRGDENYGQTHGDDHFRQKRLIEEKFFSGEGRIAFVSSPGREISRESKDLKNGVFTYYLLRGLRGEAAEIFDNQGAVTISSLVSYVQAMCKEQTPVFYGQSTRIVLSRPKSLEQHYTASATKIDTLHAANAHAVNPKIVSISSLKSPLESQVECIGKIVQSLHDINNDDAEKIGDRTLAALQRAFGFEYALVTQVKQDKSIDESPKFHGNYANREVSLHDYTKLVLGEIYPYLIEEKAKILPSRYGFFKTVSGRKSGASYIAVVPLQLEYPREFLILCGLNDHQLDYGELMVLPQ